MIKKIDRDFGIGHEKARISIIQYSKDTEVVTNFVEAASYTPEMLVNKARYLEMDKFVAQGSYVTNGLKHVIENFAGARENSKRYFQISSNVSNINFQGSSYDNRWLQSSFCIRDCHQRSNESSPRRFGGNIFNHSSNLTCL